MRRIIFQLFVSALLAIVSMGSAYGSDKYKFRTYRVEDGLSQNTIWCSLQDKDGFIWFGTKDGLNRFDGRDFIVFRRNPADTLSIGNGFIRALYEEKSGESLLVGTDDGLYRLNLIDGHFKRIELPRLENLRQTAINSICEDRAGRIWIGTFGHGIYVFEQGGKAIRTFKASGKRGGLGSNQIWKIYCDTDGVVWIGTLGSGLYRYNEKHGDFTLFSAADGLSNDIYEIYEDLGGRLWIGTWNSGLKWLDRTANTIHTSATMDGSYEAIRCITETEPGVLLIGCNKGLYRYDVKQGSNENIPLLERHPGIYVNDGIYSILRDQEGGLWIGGYFAGVNYIHRESNVFDHYRLSDSFNKTVGHVISDMVESADRTLWIATEDNGLACLNRADNSVRFIDKAKISHSNLHALMLDGDQLWIGNIAGLIDVYDIRTGRCEHYDYTRGLDVGGVYAIYKDRRGTIYVGGLNGLLRYDRKSGRFDRVMEFPVTSYVYDIKESGNGILWIATYGDGIFTYNPRSRSWRNYVHNSNDVKSLASNKIICLDTSDPSTVWIGSEGGGLSRYNVNEDNFTNIDTRDGLPNNVIYGVEHDHQGNVWLSTNKGMSCYNPKGGVIKTYSYQDGIQSSQFNYKSSLALRDGTLCFGGIDGLNMFEPDKIIVSEYLPPVRITSYTGKGKGDDYPGKHMLLCPDGDALQHIDIYDSNTIALEFVALSYKEPLKNQYAYRLSGVDKDWIMCGNENKVSYHNLDPGTYIFEVKGANGDGVWNPEIRKLEVNIHPPYYKSTTAYVIYALCILAIIGWIVNIYFIKMKRRNQIAKLRFERDKQYEYYEGQLNFFSRMAHEIRTPLSLINAPLEDIEHKYPEDADFVEAVDVIKNNTHRLLSLVNELLDFRKGSQGISLNFTLENIGEILTEIHKQMQPYVKHKDIEFRLNLPDTPVVAGVDREALNKIISNLLFNAIKYTRTRIETTLLVNEKEGTYTIAVSDNGKGIKEEDKSKIFTLFYRVKTDESIPESGSGIGLAIVKQYTEAHKGSITVANNEPTGTVFKVRMPLSLAEDDEEGEGQAPIDCDVEESGAQPEEGVRAVEGSPTDSEDGGEDPEAPVPMRIGTVDKICRLLVVEDNEDLRNFLVRKLSPDYEVISAENGKIALSLFSQYEIDLVITDIMMAEMDGLKLCRKIKSDSESSHIKVVLLTACANDSIKAQGQEAGADAYVEKPFAFSALKKQIQGLLENRSRLRQSLMDYPWFPYNAVVTNSVDNEFLTKVNDLIEKNLTNQSFGVDMMTEHMNMSRSTLHRKIKGVTNLTPNDYIRLYRLKKSAMLLGTGQYKVTEVCYMVGFNTPSYFSKCFQSQFGIVPKEFLAKINQDSSGGE